jgi:hypothetical protein
MHAGTGPHVHQMIGAQDRVAVVLHHDDRIAQIAQPPQGGKQAIIVALMQSDGRFVEHVHHAGQARADLAREADALRLAAGQAVGSTIEGEVFQSDVDQEPEA